MASRIPFHVAFPLSAIQLYIFLFQLVSGTNFTPEYCILCLCVHIYAFMFSMWQRHRFLADTVSLTTSVPGGWTIIPGPCEDGISYELHTQCFRFCLQLLFFLMVLKNLLPIKEKKKENWQTNVDLSSCCDWRCTRKVTHSGLLSESGRCFRLNKRTERKQIKTNCSNEAVKNVSLSMQKEFP